MVLVIGASGFVGRAVCSRLIEDEIPVRALTRHVGQADVVLGHLKDIEIVRGDALEAGSIIRAMEGHDKIVFLATSVSSALLERPVDELDKRMVSNLIRACNIPKPPTIIYLSWIFDPERSRSSYIETQFARERAIIESGLPYVILRAPVIVGRWGMFFRLVEAAIARMPILWLPKSVSTPCQPIYVGDVAAYISTIIYEMPKDNAIYEISGHDVLSYYDMIDLFISAMSTSKLMFPLPLSFNRYATKILAKQTGIPNQAVTAFLENMNVPMVASDDTITRDYPDIHPLGFVDALQKAIRER